MSNDYIIILASATPHSFMLINHLAERFKVTHVVFASQSRYKVLRYRLRKLGIWIVLGQLMVSVLDRIYFTPFRSGPRIKELLSEFDTRPPDGRIPVQYVQSVNGSEVQALLQKQQPGAVVVTGTGIISRRILALCPTFINIHGGITPRYRGVYGAFWAIVEGHPDLAGVTTHLIDAGVDTGAILGQERIELDSRDTPRTLRTKAWIVGRHLMEKAVREAFSNTLQPYNRNDIESHQWYSPTPVDLVRFSRNLKSYIAGIAQYDI